MGYSGARGTLIYEEKKLNAKISCQTPFNDLENKLDKGYSRYPGNRGR
jgi:hypothetical protein